MKKFFGVVVFTVLLLSGCGIDGELNDEHRGDHVSSGAVERLIDSPRHHEWVEVKNGERTIYAWVVFPEVPIKAPAVLVVHENRGLSDWVRGLADEVAEAGYIAVAPDLLSGFSEELTRTSDFVNEDEARTAIGKLDMEQVQSDLLAVAEFAKSLDGSNGKLAAMGFCWGGAQSFEFVTRTEVADAILVFYGSSPANRDAYSNVGDPIYGFYGGDDQRVNATIARAEEAMTQDGMRFEYVIYEGAGHAFMRLGEDVDSTEANKVARGLAWERVKMILSGLAE